MTPTPDQYREELRLRTLEHAHQQQIAADAKAALHDTIRRANRILTQVEIQSITGISRVTINRITGGK